MTNETQTKTETKKKSSIWTEGILSVLGRPVQIWKDSMKHAIQMANEKTKSIPGGVVDRPDLKRQDKAFYLMSVASFAGLGASAILAIIVLEASAILGLGLGSGAILGSGATLGAGIGATLGAILGEDAIKTKALEKVKTGVGIAAGIGLATIFGLGFIPTIGLGMAGLGIVTAPRTIAKSLYLAPKAMTSVIDTITLGLPSGAAQSMRAVVKSIKSVIKRKPKSQPKPVANDDQAQNCPTCVQTQQQVSDLTQKVQGLEKQFSQSGAKPKSRRTRPTAKKTSSRTVKKST